MNEQPGARLRMAIQKDGRTTGLTVELLQAIGLDFDAFAQRLYSPVRNFPLDILFARDDDIPQYVAGGTADLGIVGRNEVEERGVDVEELLPLGFGRCALVLAIPNDSPVQAVTELTGSRIATKYPRTAGRFLSGLGISADLITLSGGVELAPVLDVADGIIDLTSTGSSLVAHDLRVLAEVSRSEAVLIGHLPSLLDPGKDLEVERLSTRLRATLAARQYKYVVMNAPEASVERIAAIVPGLRSPTVVPLAERGWVAVHTVVREDVFWDVMEELKAAGAGGILVAPIEKMLL